ncbi:hypothetical protein AB0O68_01220 [Streptomyces sp. NPDC087512]|uniref:hypothetical protein n=1 Tax=Streptomyces sp. NPDC087512 TaxID=3155059 RepID=UPI00344AAD9C
MALSAVLLLLVAAVSFAVFRAARRRLGTGTALAVAAGALCAQLAGLWIAAEAALSTMG